ncbi:hypothetical protein [Acetobacter sp.]|nr:hypothetical protein [Acetobacter sp.]
MSSGPETVSLFLHGLRQASNAAKSVTNDQYWEDDLIVGLVEDLF